VFWLHGIWGLKCRDSSRILSLFSVSLYVVLILNNELEIVVYFDKILEFHENGIPKSNQILHE
jgi:hypothetical protein